MVTSDLSKNKCYHCDKEGVYELDCVDGETIWVCESCDELYTNCYKRDKAGILGTDINRYEDDILCDACINKLSHLTLMDCKDYEILKHNLTPTELDYAQWLCNLHNSRSQDSGSHDNGIRYECGCYYGGEAYDISLCEAGRWLEGYSDTREFVEYMESICEEEDLL